MGSSYCALMLLPFQGAGVVWRARYLGCCSACPGLCACWAFSPLSADVAIEMAEQGVFLYPVCVWLSVRFLPCGGIGYSPVCRVNAQAWGSSYCVLMLLPFQGAGGVWRARYPGCRSACPGLCACWAFSPLSAYGDNRNGNSVGLPGRVYVGAARALPMGIIERALLSVGSGYVCVGLSVLAPPANGAREAVIRGVSRTLLAFGFQPVPC